MSARYRDRPSSYRSLSWLLACVLLFGQMLALAHDHDTDAGPETACALCLFAHHADGSLPTPAIACRSVNTAVRYPLNPHLPPTCSCNTHYRSRAPPRPFL